MRRAADPLRPEASLELGRTRVLLRPANDNEPPEPPPAASLRMPWRPLDDVPAAARAA